MRYVFDTRHTGFLIEFIHNTDESPERNSTPWFYFIKLLQIIHCSFAVTDATVIILNQVTRKTFFSHVPLHIYVN